MVVQEYSTSTCMNSAPTHTHKHLEQRNVTQGTAAQATWTTGLAGTQQTTLYVGEVGGQAHQGEVPQWRKDRLWSAVTFRGVDHEARLALKTCGIFVHQIVAAERAIPVVIPAEIRPVAPDETSCDLSVLDEHVPLQHGRVWGGEATRRAHCHLEGGLVVGQKVPL